MVEISLPSILTQEPEGSPERKAYEELVAQSSPEHIDLAHIFQMLAGAKRSEPPAPLYLWQSWAVSNDPANAIKLLQTMVKTILTDFKKD